MHGKLAAVYGLCCLFLLVIGSGSALSRPVAAAAAHVQSPQRAHTVLNDVLARREFQQYRPHSTRTTRSAKPGWFQRITKTLTGWLRGLWRPIQRFFNWVKHLFTRVAPRRAESGASHASIILLLLLRYFIYATVAAAVLFALGLLVKHILLRQRLRDVDEHLDAATAIAHPDRRRSPEPSSWERSLHAAEGYWAQGDEREALRVLYQACLVLLDARGVLRYDESRANGEVLRELRRQGHSGVQQALTPIVRVFDRSWYGFLHISGDEFSHAVQQSRTLRDVVIGGRHA